MSKEALYEPVPTSGLKAFSSPIKGAEDDQHHGHEAETTSYDSGRYATDHRRHPDNYPKLQRHEEPTLLEIFYDLFFAATYNAYCDVKEVTNHASFKASIGFFCLLWLTWFNVTLFDVRYATDSIFSRLNTAIQLGVLIGFVVVAPKFNPTTQDAPTMQAMSVILAISRFNLVGQYAWMAVHVRRYKPTRVPLLMQMLIHLAAGAVYLGITFRFHQGYRSHSFVTWYCVSGAEAIASLLLSNYSPIVSLGKTHLMKRLTLLTVMILGEGIESIANKVLVIVKNKHAWDGTTIGYVTAAAATVYFVFLVYFDWLGTTTHLPHVRRNIWVALHLPFHLALVLFMQGFTQLLLWGKIVRQLNRAFDSADPTNNLDVVNANATSETVAKTINDQVQEFFNDYPPKLESTGELVKAAIANISSLPDKFWPTLSTIISSGDEDQLNLTDSDEGSLSTLESSGISLATAMTNSVFSAFGTEVGGEIESKRKGLEKQDGKGFQFEVNDKNWKRYGLVFAYTYLSAACTILFVLALKQTVDGRLPRGWAIIRQFIIFCMALGVGLTTILWFNDERFTTFLGSPWVMPLLALVWFTIVILTHIQIGGVKLSGRHLKWRSKV